MLFYFFPGIVKCYVLRYVVALLKVMPNNHQMMK